MSLAITCTDCTSISFSDAIGFSPDFETLKKCYENVIREFRNTETLGRRIDQALKDLQGLYEECSEENWDGYNARPLFEGAYYEARRLFKMLPSSLSVPNEITPEPDGSISLEWYRGKRMLFSISLSGKNELVYAGLFGPNKVHGTEYFGSSIPKKVIENIQDLFPKG